MKIGQTFLFRRYFN